MVVNARFLTQNITGVQRYGIEISRALKQLDPTVKFVAPRNIIHHDIADELGVETFGHLTGHLWEQIELPIYTRGRWLINLCNTAPLLKRKQLAVIHDAAVYAFPEAYSFFFKNWYRFLMAGVGFSAKKICTVSNFSKNELVKYCKIREDKIDVIYEGVEHFQKIEPDSCLFVNHNIKPKHYVLAVSSKNHTKNFQAVVKAADSLNHNEYEFVIAGAKNSRIFGDTSITADNVKYVGYVTDAQLRALYENALCFVFPSLYEGFGLPPLEAMACGCPVIASKAGSVPEILRDSALYCDPHDPLDLAAKIVTVYGDPSLRALLTEKGLALSQRYSWEKAARQLLEVLATLTGCTSSQEKK